MIGRENQDFSGAAAMKQAVRQRFLCEDLTPLPEFRVRYDQKTLHRSSQFGLGVGLVMVRGEKRPGLVIYCGHRRYLTLARGMARFASRHTPASIRMTGRARAAGGAIQPAPSPLGPGCSVSHVDHAMAGTLACFVRLRGDAAPHLLSNYHVLAHADARQGDDIRRPGRGFWPEYYRERVVARISAKTDLMFGGMVPNYTDCAAARLLHAHDMPPDPGALPAYNHAPSASGVLPPKRITGVGKEPAVADEIVWKYGARTGWTCGLVAEIDVDIPVTVPGFSGQALFMRQFTVTGAGEGAFVKPFDSGSLVLRPSGEAIGLVCAITPEGGANGRPLTMVCPLPAVLSGLNAELLLS